jgi:hypothetical protein
VMAFAQLGAFKDVSETVVEGSYSICNLSCVCLILFYFLMLVPALFLFLFFFKIFFYFPFRFVCRNQSNVAPHYVSQRFLAVTHICLLLLLRLDHRTLAPQIVLRQTN